MLGAPIHLCHQIDGTLQGDLSGPAEFVEEKLARERGDFDRNGKELAHGLTPYHTFSPRGRLTRYGQSDMRET